MKQAMKSGTNAARYDTTMSDIHIERLANRRELLKDIRDLLDDAEADGHPAMKDRETKFRRDMGKLARQVDNQHFRRTAVGLPSQFDAYNTVYGNDEYNQRTSNLIDRAEEVK